MRDGPALILNVDDNPANRYVRHRLLAAEGYRVLDCGLALEALELARRERPDLVLLDIHLPDLNGIEACRRLKADPACAGMLVLQISATAGIGSAWVDALEAGADSYLSEPVDPAVLAATVKSLLRLRRTERALKRSEDRLSLAIRSAPIALFSQDRDLRYTWVHNPISNLTADELVGRTDDEIFERPEDVALLTRLKREVIETGTGRRAEVALRFDGRDGFYDLTLEPLHGGDGAVEGVAGAAYDVTDRRRADDERERQRELLERLVGTLPVVIAALTPDLRYTLVNDRACEVVGKAREDFIGRSMTEVFPGVEATENYRSLRQAVAENRTVAIREYYTRGAKDRPETWWNLSHVPLRDAAGRVAGVLTHSQDVTDFVVARRHAEQFAAEAEARARQAEAAEAARRFSEEKLRIALDAVRMATWDYYPATRTVERTPMLETLFGFEPGTVGPLAEDLAANVHPDDRADSAAAVRRAVEEKGGCRFEYRIVRPDGSIRWLAVRGESVLGPDGEVVRLAGVVQDVTEQHAAEAALRESEARYRTLSETVPQLIWTCRADGSCDYVSRQYEAYVGRPEAELVGWGWATYLHPDDRDRTAAHWRAALSQQADYDVEFRLRRRDGAYRWFKVRAVPILDAEGRIVRWFGTCTDIEDQKRLEEELRNSESRFRQLAEAMPAIVWTADAEGRTDYTNRRWADYTGLSTDAARTDNWGLVIHPDDLEPTLRAWEQARRDGQFFQMENRLRRAEGVYRWHLARAVPARDAAGRVVKWYGTSTDIHDRKMAEAALDAHRGQLEALVADRTAELETSHEKLRRADRLATIGMLATGLGHDMGNLLLPLRIRLDALEARGLPEDMQDDLQSIRKAAEYLQRLTNGIRLLALDPDDESHAGETTDLAEWWEDAAPLLRNPLPKSVALERRFPDRPIRLKLVRHRLTQAVFNLVQNAGDALRGRESGRVTVWVEPGPRPGWVRLGVSDDGPGMAPEVAERCLQPFFTTKTRGISTGLGLSLVQGIVQRLGGAMAIETAPGAGATFILDLPEAPLPAASAAGDRPLAAVTIADMRMRSYVATILQPLGFEVAFTEAPEDAILWVVEPRSELVPVAEAFVLRDPRHRVVVFGEMPDLRHPRMIALGPEPKPAQIRQTLRDVAARDAAE
ncbi:MAG TPA: PAS domain S-box protein [Alphaproteobacteria bacterium]|nr:PAS domain S-box protein [Alphaproteobacteria bacterium]